MRRLVIALLTGGVAIWSMPLPAQRIERDVATELAFTERVASRFPL